VATYVCTAARNGAMAEGRNSGGSCLGRAFPVQSLPRGQRMKRLRRIIFNTLSVLSLLLCVGVGVIWRVSYLRADTVRWVAASMDGRAIEASYSSGQCVFVRTIGSPWTTGAVDEPPGFTFRAGLPSEPNVWPSRDIVVPATEWRFAGAQYAAGGLGSYSRRAIIIPFWALLALVSLLPAYWICRKPNPRRIFNLIALLSLLLCLATVGLWVRSYSVREMIWLREHDESGNTWRSVRWVIGRGGIAWHVYVENIGSNRPLVVSGPASGLYPAIDHFETFQDRLNGAYADYRTQTPIAYPTVAPDPIYSVFWERWGFQWVEGHTPDYDGFHHLRSVTVPLSVIAGMFALLPAVAFVSFRRRPKPGHWQKCGYDLRATPDRCPECGTIVVKASA
jgi:hypothetical protein